MNSPTQTHHSEIIFIDLSNLFIAFDYLPNWRQYPPHNELLFAFWLVRVLAGVQSGDLLRRSRYRPPAKLSTCN